MLTITIDEEIETRFQAVAAPEEDFADFLAAAAQDALARREWQAKGRAEMQAMLDGPKYTQAESRERMRQKYGYSGLTHLTHEELEEQGDAILATLPPEKIAEAERLDLI